ncbi:N-acylglucosamine 2-epimerase [Natronolimnobius sp. AArcel1]|uniref:AGE family epimerase/isomerase n=1 Tax=Natronolimnobius sp. AArcel1 TaxID=1679093 RepID=UPI0013EA5D8E|nr:AGE family epimerase/isomerase [Natronolimnobius sp. AArcel1]NGM70507.1 N-acylglucosamine 2-epimerase [Natronolimnobius sp. AArcel1]
MALNAREHRAHLLATLRLQYPDIRSDRGVHLLDPATGDPFADDQHHLVATCRVTMGFALGALVDGPQWCSETAAHALEALETAHRGNETDGYQLLVDGNGDPIDRTRSAYAHAFVLGAYARATAANVAGARSGLEDSVTVLDERFVEANGLFRSDCDPDWSEREPYRGMNANMHACEGYLAAYEATDDERFLERAETIAHRITIDLAAETDGLLWEHYTDEWTHDFAYNEDRPADRFRPPGYLPGHHAEWAKFLGLLDRYGASPPSGTDWYRRATELFEAAVDLGWTGDGFVYTADADGEVLVPDRYGWALAEAIGASAVLAERAVAHDDPEAETFRDWHEQFLECVPRFRGPAGLWYERRTAPADGDEPIAPDPPAVEPDYHPATAWYESFRSAALVEQQR